MPFQSQAQMRFLYARHPQIAKEWAVKTKSIKALPVYANKPKKKTNGYSIGAIKMARAMGS